MNSLTTAPMPTGSRQRLEWLDALRGFTMILVVAYHVNQMAFVLPPKYSSSMPFLLLFRMPLFFFVSGFLAFRPQQVWTATNLRHLVMKKMRVQLIPTIVFFLLASVMLSNKPFLTELSERLYNPTKGGYWFTLVLLYMFLIYYPFSYLESKLRRQSWVPMAILFVVSLCFYETCYLPQYFPWAQGHKMPAIDFVNYTSIGQLFMYFPFFLFGNMVHRYWSGAERVMDSRWFYPILILVAIVCTLDVLKWHTLKFAWTNLPSTIAKFSLLTIVFMYFRHYKDYFTKSHPIGAALQYIGRRTLDIYLLHFFFLPNLPTLGTFFKAYRNNFVIDVTLSVVLGLLIIAFCIITSNILRVSPLLKKYLFGRESKNTATTKNA